MKDKLSLQNSGAPGKFAKTNSIHPHHHGVAACNFSKSQGRKLLSWRFPLWFSTAVWELSSAPQPGWDYGFRVYSIVPEESAIIRSIVAQDTTAVVALFRSKEASPFDRDGENRSLLLVSLSIW
jgi:hypothetical protein